MFLDNLFSEQIKIVYQNPIILISTIVFLMIASYFDIKYRKIPNKLNLICFVIRILLVPMVGFSFNNIWGLLLGFFMILIPAMIMNKPMGGDIKTVAVLGFYLGNYSIFALIAVVIIISLLYILITNCILKKKKDFPFIPFFLLAHIILFNITISL